MLNIIQTFLTNNDKMNLLEAELSLYRKFEDRMISYRHSNSGEQKKSHPNKAEKLKEYVV